jgi:hypothetical protein
MAPRTAALVVVLALAGSAAAFAAKGPKSLALGIADFPGGAKKSRISDMSGPSGAVFAAAFNFRVGGREEEVTDQVWVVPKNAKPPAPGLRAGPESTYGSEVGQISGFTDAKSLNLPRYGEEQTANWADHKGAGGAERARAALVVRKGNVVWTLVVEDCGDLAPFGCFFGPSPKITQAQAVAELRKYAEKQKAQVG